MGVLICMDKADLPSFHTNTIIKPFKLQKSFDQQIYCTPLLINEYLTEIITMY